VLGGEGLREELGDVVLGRAFFAGDDRAFFAVTGEHGIIEGGFFLGGRRDLAALGGHVDDDVDIGFLGGAETEETGGEGGQGSRGEREEGEKREERGAAGAVHVG